MVISIQNRIYAECEVARRKDEKICISTTSSTRDTGAIERRSLIFFHVLFSNIQRNGHLSALIQYIDVVVVVLYILCVCVYYPFLPMVTNCFLEQYNICVRYMSRVHLKVAFLLALFQKIGEYEIMYICAARRAAKVDSFALGTKDGCRGAHTV